LEETAEVTAPVLKLIFERSLDTGDFPYDLRVANELPICKEGGQSAPQNYCPISTVCKVLEHISSHLMKHLENNNLLHEFQHAQ